MIKKLLFAIVVFILFHSCHVGRFVIYNFADIRDHKKFSKKEIKHSEIPFHFISATDTGTLKLPKTVTHKHKTLDFSNALRKSGTVAFVVIRNDSILYEWYRPGYKASSIVPSFSLAKSYVSLLVGIAIDDGFIKNTNEPITNYIDYLDKATFGKITIQHLLDMQSGIKFSENYFNPFGDVAKYYYGTNLKKYLRKLEIETDPGTKFRYISINSQILGLILEKATGRSLTSYLQEKLWSQVGMEYDASWSIDSKKHQTEKSFCCINARALDYAKLGRLYLNKGNWNGKQIVSEKWVEESVIFKKHKNSFLYSNQWWHTRRLHPLADTLKISKPYSQVSYLILNKKENFILTPSGNYFAQGLLGQYIFVSPKNKIIIIRLGKKEGDIAWPNLLDDISEKN